MCWLGDFIMRGLGFLVVCDDDVGKIVSRRMSSLKIYNGRRCIFDSSLADSAASNAVSACV